MSSGVGIDLLEIDRLERALKRYPRLAERVFTPAEREYADGPSPARPHLAARFAAKEAVVKALGLQRRLRSAARSRWWPASRQRCSLVGPGRRRRAGVGDRDLADALARLCGRGRRCRRVRLG